MRKRESEKRWMSLVFLALLCVIIEAASGVEYPVKEDVVKHGYFAFPQEQATVLYDAPALRLSIWNNDEILYIQAVLWDDNSNDAGNLRADRQYSDTSTLYIDTDPNVSVLRGAGRGYYLDPWLSMNGLYYAVFLDEWNRTGLRNDSLAVGSICYVNLADKGKLRIDNYVIGLKELGAGLGNEIRLGYWGLSAVPPFSITSAGDTNVDDYWWAMVIPRDKFHTFRLKRGSGLTKDKAAASWSKDTPVFTRSKPRSESNEDWFVEYESFVVGPYLWFSVPQNDANLIRKEMEAKNFLQNIAGAIGMKSIQIGKLKFTRTDAESFDLHQNGTHPEIYRTMTDAIGRYLEQRENGHTKEYILASFKEPFKLIKTRDDYLRRLAKEYPDLPIDLLKKDKPSWPQPSFLDRLRAYLPLGNNAPWPLDPNDFERTKAYYLIDGDLAWHYDVVVEPNQPTFFLPETRDAKEYNPAYVVVLKKAGEYASKKMTEAGISAGLGSIHSFWGFKKDFLKQKGIDWKPPSELGNGYYD